ncbi:P-loop NTPase fold protein [Flavobacterium maritimum]|uniref:P-loop NTPase fold protein n=1 Tax=Flavobacterium maritimum TaxID=3149042 RepID=UPI0032B3F691
MNKLDEIVLQYLKMKTNYAIVISGEWGSGKTYYYENNLKNLISETHLVTNNNKKHTPILISLFGINSIDEIQTQIVLNLYPILKSRKTKLAASLGKALFKGILKIKGLDDYYNIVSEVEIDKKDWIKFNELVIVFDDLERISKSLEIEDVIGFVNSLVEHDNVKVLLIANENKIESSNYKKIKEKVIGNTIEFIPNLSESFNGLINNYNGFSLYQEFLKNNKELILDFFGKASVNLRILNFALDYFQFTFSETKNNLSSNKSLQKFENKILDDLLKFSLAITIEYKLGEISFKERMELDSFIQKDYIRKFLRDKEKGSAEKEEKSFAAIFQEKYFPGIEYNFYTSIYDYITGGNILDVEKLIKELKGFNNIEDEILPAHEQVIKDLTYRHYSNLSDQDYKIKTRLMIVYASQGKYDLLDCLTVFHFATRLSNILKLNVNKVKTSIITGMKKGINTFEYNPSLERYLNVGEKAEFKSQMEEIKAESLKINEKIKTQSEKSKSSDLENIYPQNFDDFYSEVFQKFHYEAILKNFNIHKFYLYFLNANNSTKEKIVNLISLRYHDYNSNLKDETVFIKALAVKVEKKAATLKNNKFSDFFIQELDRVLKHALNRLESY